MSQFHKLQIKQIIKETEAAVRITFDVPESLKAEFSFKAGQYITLKTTINGSEVRRDYSICSSPSSGDLTVAVKQVKDGTFSSYANTHLNDNDALEVASPKGRFVFSPDTDNKRIIAAFAAGSGITPVLSIAKCILEEEPNSKFVLVYGNKTAKDTMFLTQLLDLQHTYSDRLSIQFVFSQAQEDDAIFGRIEKSTVNFMMKNAYKDVSIDAFYLCGPEGMIDTVKNVLIDNNIDENAIYFELFKASKASEIQDETSNDGESNITIMVDDEEHSFKMSQKQSILEAALDQDLDAPYSCQGGICSSCLARITQGSATMRQNNILTDKEVQDGLVLTCQAHPTSPSIYIDYDDV